MKSSSPGETGLKPLKPLKPLKLADAIVSVASEAPTLQGRMQPRRLRF